MNLFADMVSHLKGEEYKKAIAASAKIAWESALQSVRISAAEMELVLGKFAVAGGSAVAEGFAALREATDAYTAIEAPAEEAATLRQKLALHKVACVFFGGVRDWDVIGMVGCNAVMQVLICRGLVMRWRALLQLLTGGGFHFQVAHACRAHGQLVHTLECLAA